jgi:hypothetical protein
MGKYYLQTTDQLETLINEEKVSGNFETIIKERLGKMVKSRFLVLETTKTGVLMSISDVDVSQVPLGAIPNKEIDSALYL